MLHELRGVPEPIWSTWQPTPHQAPSIQRRSGTLWILFSKMETQPQTLGNTTTDISSGQGYIKEVATHLPNRAHEGPRTAGEMAHQPAHTGCPAHNMVSAGPTTRPTSDYLHTSGRAHSHIKGSTGDPTHVMTSGRENNRQHMSTGDMDIATEPNSSDRADSRMDQDRSMPDFLQRIHYPHAPHAAPHSEHDESTGDQGHLAQEYDRDDVVYQAQDFTSWPFPTLEMGHKPAMLYDTARAAGGPNHKGARVYIPTDLNIQEWRSMTTGHTDDEWILDTITFGFPIQYAGPPRMYHTSTYNHLSATNYSDTIRAYISKEVGMGALFGPFWSPPFTPWMR